MRAVGMMMKLMMWLFALFFIQLCVSSYSTSERQPSPSVQLEKHLLENTIQKLTAANHRARCILKRFVEETVGTIGEAQRSLEDSRNVCER
uniref:Secreted protein n=1 Tax=Ascaris lumbricoides TaxID=6252 RepID=A0A0M3ICP2_ASCLU